MKKSKWFILIISVLVAIPVIVFAFLALPWVLIYVGVWLSPDPPKPQTKYEEFPFTIVYTLDGETVTVDDVYVCEYAGIDMDEGQGKHIEWNGYYKRSNQEELVLLSDGNKKIVCMIGPPDYYMGAPDCADMQVVAPVLTMYEDCGTVTAFRDLSEEEMERYKIALIRWELPEPITNTFK